MWNLTGADGSSSNPLETIAAGAARVYQTPTPCPRIGWIVALQSDQSSSELIGQIRASYPGAGTVQKTIVESFNVKPMDCFFIPWPSVELRLTADSAGTADAQVNFYPVNDAETAVVFKSVLFYFESTEVEGDSTATIDPPDGATGFWPCLDNQGTLIVSLVDSGGNTLFSFGLGGGNDTDFPQAVGAQYFPLVEGASITAQNESVDPDAITIDWRFDFRHVGGV